MPAAGGGGWAPGCTWHVWRARDLAGRLGGWAPGWVGAWCEQSPSLARLRLPPIPVAREAHLAADDSRPGWMSVSPH